MKKLLVFCLSILLLAGCSSNETVQPETTATPDATTPTETPESTDSENVEAVVTDGKYVITNQTGETLTELYIYLTGNEDKGTNHAEGGLADGETVTIEVSFSEEEAAAGVNLTLDFTTESGRNEANFKTLHLEEANMNLLAEDADAYTSATPFNWGF